MILNKASGLSENDARDKSDLSKKAKLAEKKAEKRRNAEERKIALRRQELQREIDLGARNTKRHQREWREMMMRVKMPILREELEVAWHTFDRSLDIKDCRTSLMQDALEKAEEQYQMNLRSHMETIDRLIREFRARLQEREDRHHSNIRELLTNSANEADRINYKEYEDEVFLRSVIFGMRRRLDDSLSNAQGSNIAKVNALNEENRNSRRMAAAILEKRLTVHWHELREILKEYEDGTKDRRDAYEIIKAKDDRERSIIARQVLKTSHLFETIRNLRQKIGQLRATADARISEMMEEHKFFHESYWTMKKRFSSEQKRDKICLLILSKEYNQTLKHLNALVRRAKQILVVVHDCSKYETQDEKIMPFSAPVEIEELRQRKQQQQFTNLPNAVTCPQVLHELEVKLELFWRRTGAASIITTELRIERDRLKQESLCLRQCLRHCLSEKCINVSNDDEEMLDDLRKRTISADSYETSLAPSSS